MRFENDVHEIVLVVTIADQLEVPSCMCPKHSCLMKYRLYALVKISKRMGIGFAKYGAHIE